MQLAVEAGEPDNATVIHSAAVAAAAGGADSAPPQIALPDSVLLDGAWQPPSPSTGMHVSDCTA